MQSNADDVRAPVRVVGSGPRPRRSTIPSGDVALCSVPPFSTQLWLAMGVILHAAQLAQAGVRVRVVRPIDPPFAVPRAVLQASMTTFTRDPAAATRRAAMDAAYVDTPAFFDGIVDELLSGAERLVGLSVWRNNVDVALHVARLLKARSPGTFVMLGGPEAIDGPQSLQVPWVDAVIGLDAECVQVAVVEALLAGRPERAAGLPNVWLNPRFGVTGARPALPEALAPPPLPPIDYAALLPLLVGDAEPTVPLLLNWGCPYHCGFCANRNVYSRFTPGTPEEVVDRIDAIMTAWVALHGGDAPGLTLQFSDATTNALPAQLDAVLAAVAERAKHWGTQPLIRGQTLFDSRITDERVQLMARSGFRSTFFGLDAASDRLRRALRKPGTMAQVAAAMLAYHRGGAGGLHFGVPIGFPGETDDDFRATERFVEWALGLEGTIGSITVLPYALFMTMQEPALCQPNTGESRGVLWRTAGPGGDPATRARRFMRLFELIDGRVPVTCPFPPFLFLRDMLPDEDPGHLDGWMDRYGRSFDQITPMERRVRRQTAPADPEFTAACARAQRALAAAVPGGAWRIESFDCALPDASRPAMAVFFCRDVEPGRLIVVLEPRDDGGATYAQSRHFNITYRNRWRGRPCDVDHAVLSWCVETLRRAEVDAPE